MSAVEFFALQEHFAERDKRRADVLGHLHEVFPRIGIVFAFPHDRGNVFRDVARKTDETVAFNEGHHIVFQRQQIVRAHSQAIILSDEGRVRSDQMWKAWHAECGG